jgi:hypothetical protein
LLATIVLVPAFFGVASLADSLAQTLADEAWMAEVSTIIFKTNHAQSPGLCIQIGLSTLAQPPLVMGECEYGKGLVVFNRSQTHTPGAAPGQRSLDDWGRFFRSCKPTVKMRCLLP